MAKNTIYHGHVLDRLDDLQPESIHTVVTSPPYWGMREYQSPPQIWGGSSTCIHQWEDSTQVNPCQACGAWLGELGEETTPELYVSHLIEVFSKIHTVLRPDGVAWLNLSYTYWGGKGQSGRASPEKQAERVRRGESILGRGRRLQGLT